VTDDSLHLLLDDAPELMHEDLAFDFACLSCDLFGLLGLELFLDLSGSFLVGIGMVGRSTLRYC
jgi:hypothetical protein